MIVVSAIQSSGKENVGKENNKSSIFLSYIFLSAGRNDDHGPYDEYLAMPETNLRYEISEILPGFKMKVDEIFA